MRCCVKIERVGQRRGYATWRHDPVLGVKKYLQISWKRLNEFLPREDFQAHMKLGGADGGKDSEPGFAKVWAPRVVKNAKTEAEGVCGEHVADELVAREAGRGGARHVEERGLPVFGWNANFFLRIILGKLCCAAAAGDGYLYRRKQVCVKDRYKVSIAM